MHVDVNDRKELSAYLSYVFLFAERLNTIAAARQARGPSHLPELVELAHASIDRLIRGGEPSKDEPDPSLVHAITASTVARRGPIKAVPSSIFRAFVDDLAARALEMLEPEDRAYRYFLHETPLGLETATRPIGSTQVGEATEPIAALFAEELVDPISLVSDFLVSVLGVRTSCVAHYLQVWLKHRFGIRYTPGARYAVMEICSRLNVIFFGKRIPTRRDAHLCENGGLSLPLLLQEIASLTRSFHRRFEDLPTGDATTPYALGLLLFFKMQDIVRLEYRSMKPNMGEDLPRSLAEAIPRQVIRGRRPTDRAELLTVAFGALSGVPGLCTAMRGGLLPHASRGRTFIVQGPAGAGKTVFSLQLMADMAYRGRVAIYISLEESYDAIVDRLYTFDLISDDHFCVVEGGNDLGERIRQQRKREPNRGVLALFSLVPGDAEANGRTGHGSRDQTTDLAALIRTIGRHCVDLRWKALTIDSANALELSPAAWGERGEMTRRYQFDELISAIDENNFWGVLISEEGDTSLRMLPYLADTVIEFGVRSEAQTRWMEVHKCRTQPHYPGRHTMTIDDGRGVSIYPSMSAVRGMLHNRASSRPSETRYLAMSKSVADKLSILGIAEHSATLITGAGYAAKRDLLLNLVTAPTRDRAGNIDPDQAPPNIYLVSFRTPESKFERDFASSDGLMALWSKAQTHVRWYSPDDGLTSEQLTWELWQHLERNKRRGTPVDRVAFEGIHLAEDTLPSLKRERLLWSTLLDLLTTEPVTCFFVGGPHDPSDRTQSVLLASVDQSLDIVRGGVQDAWSLSLTRAPGLAGRASSPKVDVSFGEDGLLRAHSHSVKASAR